MHEGAARNPVCHLYFPWGRDHIGLEKTLQDWLTTSGYESPYSYNFQYYDARFKGMDRNAESVLDVYVPVVKIA
jgi:hypothetical protein